jgi:hypothetical protein
MQPKTPLEGVLSTVWLKKNNSNVFMIGESKKHFLDADRF